MDYFGTLNFTENGIECQRWDAQHPHEHAYQDIEVFPDKDIPGER